jgi:hypothetical protein
VDHRADRVVRVHRGECLRQLLAVGHVAGDHTRCLAQVCQQGVHAGCGGAAAAQQQQVPDVVACHQVPGQHAAQAAGAAGDHDRAVGVPRRFALGVVAGQAGGQHRTVAEYQLGFVGSECREQGRVVVVKIDEGEPAGVFALCGADQAPHGRADEVAGGGAAGHEHEPAVTVVGQPLPHHGQDGRQAVVYRGGQVAGRNRDQHQRCLVDDGHSGQKLRQTQDVGA